MEKCSLNKLDLTVLGKSVWFKLHCIFAKSIFFPWQQNTSTLFADIAKKNVSSFKHTVSKKSLCEMREIFLWQFLFLPSADERIILVVDCTKKVHHVCEEGLWKTSVKLGEFSFSLHPVCRFFGLSTPVMQSRKMKIHFWVEGKVVPNATWLRNCRLMTPNQFRQQQCHLALTP